VTPTREIDPSLDFIQVSPAGGSARAADDCRGRRRHRRPVAHELDRLLCSRSQLRRADRPAGKNNGTGDEANVDNDTIDRWILDRQ
jgi:hypothetical protein